MRFDWSEYFSLAQELVGQSVNLPPGQEAKSRAAISRAYYAVFCECRNHLRDNEMKQLPGGNVHRHVKEEFLNSSDVVRQGIGRTLDRLRIERNEADYEDRISNLAKSTAFTLTLAERAISDLSRL